MRYLDLSEETKQFGYSRPIQNLNRSHDTVQKNEMAAKAIPSYLYKNNFLHLSGNQGKILSR